MHNFKIFSEKCWSQGNIEASVLDEVPDIFTVEECQHQCSIKSNCYYFKFDGNSGNCSRYGENAMQQYNFHDPLLLGPKECMQAEGNFNYILLKHEDIIIASYIKTVFLC